MEYTLLLSCNPHLLLCLLFGLLSTFLLFSPFFRLLLDNRVNILVSRPFGPRPHVCPFAIDHTSVALSSSLPLRLPLRRP
jgi:hypothetical protein